MAGFMDYIKALAARKDAEKCITVYIRPEENRDNTIMLQSFDGWSVRIEKSLLTVNNVVVDDDRYVHLPFDLYNHWFLKQRNAVRAEKIKYELFLYKSNLPLFWKYRRHISENKELFDAPVPLNFYGIKTQATLGGMAQVWENNPQVYTHTCPKCGGTMIIYDFAGNPMTGTATSWMLCTDCGHNEKKRDSKYAALRNALIRGISNRGYYNPDALDLEDVVYTLRKLDKNQ